MKRMKASKKGVNLLFPAITLILMLVMLWARLTIPIIKTDVLEKDIEVRAEMHTMGNALDAAKLYMETALAYSTYQACYDTLRNGGWNTLSGKKVYQGYGMWEPPEQHPDMLEFKSSLESSIKENLGLYRGTKASYTFLSQYYVNLPSYTSVNAYVDEETGKLSVAAGAESNLNIQKTQESGEHIRLEKYGFLQGEYNLDCYGIYAKGLEVYSKAKTATEGIVSQLNLPSMVKLNSEETLDSKLASYKTQFNDGAKQAVYGLSETSADYDVSVYFISSDLKCTEYEVTPDGSKIRCPPEAYARFEITNIRDDQQFPVYDGQKVVMSPMTLVFVGKFGGS